MPAVSKAQQKLFGLVKAVKSGDVKSSAVSKDVKDIAKSMSTKEIDKFAGTKHKGLPEKKKKEESVQIEELRNTIREVIKQSLQEAHYTSRTYISNLEQAWDGPVDAYDDLNNFFADVKQHPDVYGDYKAWAKQIAKVLQKYK